jgi:hypothetical protein
MIQQGFAVMAIEKIHPVDRVDSEPMNVCETWFAMRDEM